MLKIILALQLTFFLATANASALSCSEYVNTDLKLIKTNSELQTVDTNPSVPFGSLEGADLALFIKAEILYSDLFYAIYLEANIFQPKPKYWVGRLSSEDLNDFALLIYNKFMEKDFSFFNTYKAYANNYKSGILNDPLLTYTVLHKTPKGIALSLIKESLIHMNQENRIINLSAENHDHRLAMSIKIADTLAKGSMVSLVSGAAASVLMFDPSYFLYGVTATASLISLERLSIHFFNSKATEKHFNKRLQNQVLQFHTQPEKQAIIDSLEYYEKGKFLNQLDQINQEANQFGFSPIEFTGLRDILSFGEQSTALHAKLIQTFHLDFRRMMSIYDANSDDIEKLLNDLKNNKTINPYQTMIDALKDLLTELIEATVLSASISQKIIEIIDQDLDRLKTMNEQANAGDMFKRTQALIYKKLLESKIIQTQFLASLDNIHHMLFKYLQLIESLRTINLALQVNLVQQDTQNQLANQATLALESLKDLDHYLDESSLLEGSFVVLSSDRKK